MSNLRSNIPKFIVAPLGVAGAGKHIYELPKYTLALVDNDTNLTVTSIEKKPGKYYRLAFVTGNDGMKNKQFGDLLGAGFPVYSDFSRMIDEPTFFEDIKDAAPFVATLGYDGISACKTLSLECGKTYGLQIQAAGQAVRDDFGRHLSEMVTFSTGCCEGCTLEEKCSKTLDTIIKEIKNQLYFLDNFLIVEKLVKCCVEPEPFDKKLYKEWEITLCDNGTNAEVALLERQYPDFEIERIKRIGIFSTYQVCVPADEVLEDYVVKNTAKLVCGECPDCPEGFKFTPGGEKYIICFDTAASAGVTTLEEFTLAYYEDQTTAQATIDTLIEAAGALVPDYVATTAQIIEANCEKLTLQVCITEDAALTEHGLADVSVTHIGKCLPKCQGEVTYPWCPGDEKYKITRNKCITIKKDDCSEGVEITEESPLFLEIQKELALIPTVDETTLTITGDNDCLVSFEVTQCNNECLMDGCDTTGEGWATFDHIPSFKGRVWEDCPCEGWSFDADTGCPVYASTETLEDCLCGLKFTTKIVEPDINSACSFDPSDQLIREQTRLEVTLIERFRDQNNGMNCDIPEVPWTILQEGTMGEGYGLFALRELILSSLYENSLYFSKRGKNGALLQEKLGYEYNINPQLKYRSISFRYSDRKQIDYHDNNHGRIHLAKLYVEATNVDLYEELKDFVTKLYNTTALYQ